MVAPENIKKINAVVEFSRTQQEENRFKIIGFPLDTTKEDVQKYEIEDLKVTENAREVISKEWGMKLFVFAHIKWAYGDYVRQSDNLKPPPPNKGEKWLCTLFKHPNTFRVIALPIKLLEVA